jgi:hypothetical protein
MAGIFGPHDSYNIIRVNFFSQQFTNESLTYGIFSIFLDQR